MKAIVIFIFLVAAYSGVAQNCSDPNILCVDDTSGPNQEFLTIQSAVDIMNLGDTVLVFNGTYQGFRISQSGTSSQQIVIKAIENNVLINSSEPVSGDEHIYISNSDYVTIDGFIVANAGKHGIGFHDATATSPVVGIQVLNNTVYGSGSANIYMSQTSFSLAEGNETYNSVNEHGIYLANAGSDNTTLRNNKTHNNNKAGIHFNGDLSVGGDGIISDILVEQNEVYENGLNGLNMDGVQNSTIQNNIIHDNSNRGLRAFKIDGAEGPKNLNIINNSFYDNSNWAMKITADGGGHNIFNNIFLSNGGSLIVDNTSFNSDNNIVMDNLSIDGENTIIDLATWQSMGYGLNSVIETPEQVYVNPSNSNFNLLNSSAAVNDIGVLTFNGVDAPLIDFNGNVRPQGTKTDLGAIEYGESLPIELINFKALVQKTSVLLKWQTATETNNDYFTIEKSKNTNNWVVLKKIDGAGNSSNIQSYHAIDKKAYNGLSYYRLKQTDFDGTYRYSPIEVVSLQDKGLILYPNPFTNKIFLQNLNINKAEISIFGVLGQNLTQQISMQYMDDKMLLDFNNLKKGLYIIKINTIHSYKIFKH